MAEQISNETNQDWEFYELQAEFCKAMAHPLRIAIILHLKEKAYSVAKLAEQLGIGQTNLSQHLAILRDVGAITAKRSGANMIYSIADERLVAACSLVRQILEERISRQKALFR